MVTRVRAVLIFRRQGGGGLPAIIVVVILSSFPTYLGNRDGNRNAKHGHLLSAIPIRKVYLAICAWFRFLSKLDSPMCLVKFVKYFHCPAREKYVEKGDRIR